MMSRLAKRAIGWTEQGRVPDSAIRAGIRRLLAKRLEEIHADDIETSSQELNEFVTQMNLSEIAPLPKLANEQHYEVPAAFFEQVLGKHKKYSSCYWTEQAESLDEAETEALRITCRRAGVADGMEILDLGCGWGSLSLWIASHYPQCRVTSVSNSASQRLHIQTEADRRGLSNISVLTRDMNEFQAAEKYDRIVSVEMFEHMRNYGELFRRISSWLRPDGRFFMHIFCHRSCAYPFEDQGAGDWMSRHFFSGGIMPSVDLPLRFPQHLSIERQWSWNGRHYEKTANAWLANMDAKRSELMPVLAATYGAQHATQWFHRWRIFFMACAELFAHSHGRQWFINHYLFTKAEDQ
jgi:cyclopropane-fatty-acyl-phospholipid synthase